MKTNYSFCGAFGLVVSFILLTLSCSGHPSLNDPTTSNIESQTPSVPSITESASKTSTAAISARTPPTETPTVTSVPTDMPLPTASSTWTPVPTLPPAEALEALLKLYNDNGGCELPCWWGIIPGETSWQEARTKLSPLGWVSDAYGSETVARYEYEFVVPESIDPLGYMGPDISVQNGIIVGISLNSRWVRRDFDYSLAGSLKAFGVPDEIWLKVVTDTPFLPYYEMDLFYSTKGVLLSTDGTAQTQEDHLTICPQEFKLGLFPAALALWSPSENVTYQTVYPDMFGRKNINRRAFSLLEELTDNFNHEDFYETYLDPKARTCFGVAPANQP